jgi:hypothetical protein
VKTHLNGAEVHEDVLAAIGGGDEAEAFLGVEPFDCSLDLSGHDGDCKGWLEGCCVVWGQIWVMSELL